MAYKAKNCIDIKDGFVHLGAVGDKGPEGEQGPPGHVPLYELGNNEPAWVLDPHAAPDSVAEQLSEERRVYEANYNKLVCTIANLENNINYRFEQAKELDKERVLAIAELKSRVLYLESMLEEKAQEAKVLRKKLHAVSISKPVRKVKRRKYDSQGQDTPKPGAGG